MAPRNKSRIMKGNLRLNPGQMVLRGLYAPRNCKEFKREWARAILVDYMKRVDPEWLLASVLKVIDVYGKDNPHPGNLCDSYIVEVSYKEREDHFSVESWFVKIPKSVITASMDRMEVFMYREMFPLFQEFVDKMIPANEVMHMPIPIVFHAFYNGEGVEDIIVMENLRDQGYKPLRPETMGLIYMRAAMKCLATVHATAFAFQHNIGGKRELMKQFPLIKEDNLCKMSVIKEPFEELILPYLVYMAVVQPDIQHQMGMLVKFHKQLFTVFKKIHRSNLRNMKTLVHGDSKVDNFMFKKVSWSVEDEYMALLIDWQGVRYDFVSTDLMWSLYGFMKNFPDKNTTIDSFLDYSLEFYYQELIQIMKLLKVEPGMFGIPTDAYFAVQLLHQGFVYEFLKTAIIKPVLTLKDPDLLLHWFKSHQAGNDDAPLPREEDMFKTGSNFVNFVHLYITIATEIGAFQELGQCCFNAVKESLLMESWGEDKEVDTESEDELKDPDKLSAHVDEILKNGSKESTGDSDADKKTGERNETDGDDNKGELEKHNEQKVEKESTPVVAKQSEPETAEHSEQEAKQTISSGTPSEKSEPDSGSPAGESKSIETLPEEPPDDNPHPVDTHAHHEDPHPEKEVEESESEYELVTDSEDETGEAQYRILSRTVSEDIFI